MSPIDGSCSWVALLSVRLIEFGLPEDSVAICASIAVIHVGDWPAALSAVNASARHCSTPAPGLNGVLLVAAVDALAAVPAAVICARIAVSQFGPDAAAAPVGAAVVET